MATAAAASTTTQLEERVREFHAAWIKMSCQNGQGFDEWWNTFFSSKCEGIIRSSGNPLSREQWKKMISSPDVKYDPDTSKHQLVAIDSIQLFADGNSAAITTMTVDLFFSYKETPNEDRAKVTIVWEKVENKDEWKIVHFQRATGQPIPK
ncbi:MAG: hypothetical protein SGILL_006220 [Bacillariaceae sp.]